MVPGHIRYVAPRIELQILVVRVVTVLIMHFIRFLHFFVTMMIGRSSRLLATCSLLLPSLNGVSCFQRLSLSIRRSRLLQQCRASHQLATADDADDPPFTWHQLQDIVGSGRLDQLKRSKIIQQAYEEHKVDILRDYATMYDFILYDKFGLDRTTNADGIFVVQRPSSNQILTALALNSFPYHVGCSVDHWVL